MLELGIPIELIVVALVVTFAFFGYVIIFKDRIIRKLEREAQKSVLSWEDRYGNRNSEEVLFKKSKIPLIGDWGRIYPPVNEDGSINYTNLFFGGKKNFIRLVLMLVILALVFFWVIGTIGAGKEYLNGDKYVIIEKDAFNKFCSTAITSGAGEIVRTENNISLYLENIPTGE